MTILPPVGSTDLDHICDGRDQVLASFALHHIDIAASGLKNIGDRSQQGSFIGEHLQTDQVTPVILILFKSGQLRRV